MDQANLLMVAMAERCLRIIQDKPEDVRLGLPGSLRPDHLRGMCKLIIRMQTIGRRSSYIAGSDSFRPA